jgi:hypothetical protein
LAVSQGDSTTSSVPSRFSPSASSDGIDRRGFGHSLDVVEDRLRLAIMTLDSVLDDPAGRS